MWVSLKIRESARAAKFQRPLKAHSLGTDEEIFQLQFLLLDVRVSAQHIHAVLLQILGAAWHFCVEYQICLVQKIYLDRGLPRQYTNECWCLCRAEHHQFRLI